MPFHGQEIFVARRGTGSPVLVLHGFPASSFDFARRAPSLEDHHKLLFFDFLGYGFSSKPRPHLYSLFEQATIAETVAHH